MQEDHVRITGADELGVIYGIYRVSRELLGVDPYWYFKDLEPARRRSVSVTTGTVESEEPTFRYRGWFVNDEDLLTEWKDGGGKRHISYPFYHQVVQLDVLDRVFEALLRAGGNLIIPASFVDVMNEPEARLVGRGLRDPPIREFIRAEWRGIVRSTALALVGLAALDPPYTPRAGLPSEGGVGL